MKGGQQAGGEEAEQTMICYRVEIVTTVGAYISHFWAKDMTSLILLVKYQSEAIPSPTVRFSVEAEATRPA